MDSLRARGFDSVHWAAVGDPRAPDSELVQWSRDNDRILVTHDLGISAILAATGRVGPSVIQVRTGDLLHSDGPAMVASALKLHSREILDGALVVVEPSRSRVRLLPFRP